MNTCKTCKYWTKNNCDYEYTHLGDCDCPKWVDGCMGDAPPDGVKYHDYEGYMAYFETGEDFGCIHWEE